MLNVRASYAVETEDWIRYLVDVKGLQNNAILYQDDGFGRVGPIGVTQALAKHGMAESVFGTYTRNTTAVKTALLDIRATAPQAVVMVGAYKPIAEFIKLGLNPTFVNISFVGSSALAQELGPEGQDVIISQVVPFPWDDSMPIVARYQAALTVENPDATYDFVSMEGYLVGRLAIKTVRAAGQDLTRACLLAAMQGMGDVDLAATIETPFEDGYEHLRQDFNGALDSLSDPMSTIVSSTDRIGHGSKAIAKSSDDLSRRTDRSAATLKEPAAALALLTNGVQTAAAQAKQANGLVEQTRKDAVDSREIVREIVQAMDQISASSEKIARIVHIIDNIAFQTNLLALYAGVEAARAGDAGRGLAVVASEVRSLAQNSSDAARDISDLISYSGESVARGVALIGNADTALSAIIDAVAELSDIVEPTAGSMEEKSSGISEINVAVGQIDGAVQRNAVMSQDTTQASLDLIAESVALRDAVG